MKKFKRIAAAVLAVTMAVGMLAGCGKKSNSELNKIDKNTIYREEVLDISFPANFNVNNAVFSDKNGFFSGSSYNEQTYEQKMLVMIVNFEDNSLKTVDLNIENGWISNFVVLSNGGFAAINNQTNYDDSDPMNPIYESFVELMTFDAEGKKLASVNLTKEYEMDYVSTLVAVDDGIFVDGYTMKLVLDNDLKLKNKKKDENAEGLGEIFKLRDGSYVVGKWSEQGGIGYYKYDINSFTVGEQVNMIDTSQYTVLQGKGCDFFLRDNTQISKYNVGDEAPTPLFNFINSDLYTSYFNAFAPFGDDGFIGTYSDWNSGTYKYNVCKYTKVDPADVKDKELLSLGCLYLDDTVRKFVVDFNRKSDDYRIVVANYSLYNTADDYMAGMNKFNSDIAAGKGPDIIISESSDQVSNFIEKGLFADLTKYFENDPDVSVDDLLPNIVEATSKNGKIYQVIPSFMVRTAVGKKSVIGDREGWTIEEMMDFASSLPADKKLFHEMTRESFLSAELAVNTTDYVDLNKAKCNFDSDSFKKILEYMKTLKKSDDYWNELYGEDDEMNWEEYETEVYADKAALMSTIIYGAQNYKNLLRADIGSELAFVGFPSEERKGSCILSNMSVGISSKSRNAQGAWELIKQFLSSDYQDTVYNIPVLKSSFDKTCDALKEKPYWTNEKGEKEYYDDTRWIGGKDVKIDPLNDAEVEAFKTFIYSVDKLGGGYTDIENIIYEEAAPFFEGQKSVDEVANIIQSRASIFVSEKQ